MVDKDPSLSHLRWSQIPELKAPFLVAGFHGWSNAGSVSSDTLHYLTESLRPQLVATLNEEPFAHYTVDRPVAQIEDGLIHELEPMVAELTYWTNADGDHDLVLLLAREPHLNWSAYTKIVLDAMGKLNVQRLYTIGGVQDTISHAAPAVVSIVGSSASVVSETIEIEEGIRAAEYYGPVSIHSHLIKACTDNGMEGISLWGHVPAYLQKCPRLVAKLVTILNKAAGMQCPIEILAQRSIELNRKINEAISKDPNLKQFVESMEAKESVRPSSGRDDKIIRLNDFLRKDPPKDRDP